MLAPRYCNMPGLTSRCRELVGTDLAVGVRHGGVDQRRLADAGKPDQGDGGVAVFLDGVAGAAAGGGLVLEFLLELRELGLQPADVCPVDLL